ncbi:MAG: GNAT family N-acetyltransferase [Rhodococcus sp. (in: high G+C Gram-positive bacteria)]
MTDLRRLGTAAELLESRRVFRAAMVGLPQMPTTAENVEQLHEPGRAYGAFDGSTMIGTTESTRGTLTLPGGARVPHMAVTHVGVVPTHTRRGVVSELLRGQLRDGRADGEVVATLRASEAVIYGRYGYGVATSSVSAEVLARRAAVREGAATCGETRLLDTDTDAIQVFERIAAAHPSDRPGTIDRRPVWWNALRLRSRDDTGPVWNAVHSTGGEDDGFVRYRPDDPMSWWSGADRRVTVEDLHAPNDAVFADLVRFLLRLDLVDRLTFPALPTDTVLPLLMTDRRSVQLERTEDETWLRILDVPAALSARTYNPGSPVTIAIEDADLVENAATYRVGDGMVRVVDSAPDLTVHVRELGAVLLGGTSWGSLVTGGLAHGAPEAADVLFRTSRAPFAGVGF